MTIYGNEVNIPVDIEYDRNSEDLIIFDQLIIENKKYGKNDSFQGFYGLKSTDSRTYLYMIDSFPVGMDWKYKMVEVLSWTLDSVENPTQILDHTKISDKNIDELIKQIEVVKAGNQIMSSKEMSLFLKKLYILNLRCCKAEDDRMFQSSRFLTDIEKYHQLDLANRDLRFMLLSFLENHD